MIKQYWQSLSRREQWTLGVGGIFLMVFISIYWVWLPLANSNKMLQEKIAQDQPLISWMKTAVSTLQGSHETLHSESLVGNLLPALELQLSDGAAGKRDAVLTAISAEKVQIVFEEIEFDNLILWLGKLEQQGALVESARVGKVGDLGMVEAELVVGVQG